MSFLSFSLGKIRLVQFKQDFFIEVGTLTEVVLKDFPVGFGEAVIFLRKS